MTGFLSPAHVALLLLVLMLVFGAKRLPESGRSLGTGLREFKHTLNGEHDPQPPVLAAAADPTANAGAAAERVPVEPRASRPAASVPRGRAPDQSSVLIRLNDSGE